MLTPERCDFLLRNYSVYVVHLATEKKRVKTDLHTIVGHARSESGGLAFELAFCVKLKGKERSKWMSVRELKARGLLSERGAAQTTVSRVFAEYVEVNALEDAQAECWIQKWDQLTKTLGDLCDMCWQPPADIHGSYFGTELSQARNSALPLFVYFDGPSSPYTKQLMDLSLVPISAAVAEDSQKYTETPLSPARQSSLAEGVAVPLRSSSSKVLTALPGEDGWFQEVDVIARDLARGGRLLYRMPTRSEERTIYYAVHGAHGARSRASLCDIFEATVVLADLLWLYLARQPRQRSQQFHVQLGLLDTLADAEQDMLEARPSRGRTAVRVAE